MNPIHINSEFWDIIYKSYNQKELDEIRKYYKLISEKALARRKALRDVLRERGYGR